MFNLVGGAAPLEKQHTLRGTLSCVGVGLHGGQRVSLAVRPAPGDSGIVFLRRDVPAGRGVIPARWDAVVDTQLCTMLSNEHGITVATIEHLMAALAGCGVDNALVELDGPEVPIMDGSSAPFVALIEQVGRVAQTKPRRMIRVLAPLEVQEGDKFARLEPGPAVELAVEIDFPSTVIGAQSFELTLAGRAFARQVAHCRTFGFKADLERLWARGQALGGSLNNAILVDGDRVVNPQGLRCPDEFVRHKLLDCVGDLALAGAPLLGRFQGYKPGHGLNNRLLRALFLNPQAWCWEPAGVQQTKTAGSTGLAISQAPSATG